MPRLLELTLGAGKLFFNREDALGVSLGEFYIGNTSSLARATDEERLEHFSSDVKTRDKDASILLRADATISFTTDDIQPQNLAILFKGSAANLAVIAAASVVEPITVRRGHWYQLGTSNAAPTGVRLITLTSVQSAVPAVIPNVGGVNFQVDLALGRIYIQDDAPDIIDGAVITVTYGIRASSRSVIINKGDTVRGALRYISDNTTGTNRDVYWPLVEITPDGDYEFKGDDWNEMSFSGEVLRRGTLFMEYIDGRAVATI